MVVSRSYQVVIILGIFRFSFKIRFKQTYRALFCYTMQKAVAGKRTLFPKKFSTVLAITIARCTT